MATFSPFGQLLARRNYTQQAPISPPQNTVLPPQPQLPFAVAHRGASGTAPENTLAAIRLASALGARCIEIDASVTADGVAVLHHDDAIDRCSNGSGLLLQQPAAHLRTLDFGGWFDPHFTGEKIPTLAETMALCATLGLGCNLEIKTANGWDEPTARAVCNAAAGWPTAESPLVISSFSERALVVAATLLPDVPRSLLAEIPPENWQERLKHTQSNALHTGDTSVLSAERLKPILSAGIPVRVYTVDDPERASALREMGVECVFTNHPERFVTPA